MWVDRRAAGTGSWHEYLGEGPETGWRNLLTLDERLEKLKSHVHYWEGEMEVQEVCTNFRMEARIKEPCVADG